MAKTLTIAGTNYLPYYKSNTVKIREMLRKTNVMTFQVVVKSISNKPQEGAEVIYKDGSRFLFAGFISKVDPTEVGKGQLFTYDVEVSDYSYIFNNKIARRAYTTSATLKSIVEDLMDAYVDSTYGYTTTNVDIGPDVASVSFDHLTIKKCFEKLTKLTGYVWWVDYERNLYFKSQQSEIAPESFTDSSTNLEAVEIGYDTAQLRNSVIVIGSPDGVQSLDLLTETFTGDGETTLWDLQEKPALVTAIKINGVDRNWHNDIETQNTDVFNYNFANKTLKLTGDSIPHGTSANTTAGFTIAEYNWVGRDILVTGASQLVDALIVDVTEITDLPDGDIVFGIRATDSRSGSDLIQATKSATSIDVGQNTLTFSEPVLITRGSSYFAYVGRQGSTIGTIKIKEETLASNQEYTSTDQGDNFGNTASDKLIDIKIQTQAEPTPTTSDSVTISYYPSIPIVEVREDPTSIAFFAALDSGDGVYEYTVKEPTITTLEEAAQRAQFEIDEFSTPLVNGRITTRTSLLSGGSVFKPGQVVTVNFPTYNLVTDTAFLIQEVGITLTEDGTNTEYIYSIRFGGKVVGIQELLETLASQQSTTEDTPADTEIVTIEHVTDVLEFDDSTTPTTLLETPPYQYGPTGPLVGKWNLSEWKA